MFHEHTKHIKVDCHYIREALTTNVISLPYISINLQVVDDSTAPFVSCRQIVVG